MSKTPKDKDREKGDEVLRRMLKTPPKEKSEGQSPPALEEDPEDRCDTE